MSGNARDGRNAQRGSASDRRAKPAPRVVIIIPTYNRAASVCRAIDSVLSQTYSDLGVIVVDDGSTDETPELLNRYADDPRLRLVRHDHNRGVNSAKNTGLRHLPTDCRYFGIFDSDDVLLPEAVATLVRVLDSSEGAYSQAMGWYRDLLGGAGSGRMTHRTGPVTYEDALTGRFTGDFWKLVRRDALRGRMFEERASGGLASVWWGMMKEKPAWLVPDVVGLTDTSGTDRVSNRGYSAREALRSMWAYQAVLTAVGADMRRVSPTQYASLTSEMAKWAAFAGRSERARRASRQALRAYPSSRTVVVSLIALTPSPVLRWLASARGRKVRARA